jgi:hypothetical protein
MTSFIGSALMAVGVGRRIAHRVKHPVAQQLDQIHDGLTPIRTLHRRATARERAEQMHELGADAYQQDTTSAESDNNSDSGSGEQTSGFSPTGSATADSGPSSDGLLSWLWSVMGASNE